MRRQPMIQILTQHDATGGGGAEGKHVLYRNRDCKVANDSNGNCTVDYDFCKLVLKPLACVCIVIQKRSRERH